MEHVGGDMFESIPKGEVIFMKVNISAIKNKLNFIQKATYNHVGKKNIFLIFWNTWVMQWILHDWSDEHCSKLLKNCYNALPEFGKVISVESILPEHKNRISSSMLDYVTASDVLMLAIDSGKERTLKEYEALAKESGFASVKVICSAAGYSVLEFHKKP